MILKLLNWWVRQMLKHRIKSLSIALLITAAAGILASQLDVRTALLDMIKKSSPRAEVYDQMRQKFGSDAIMLVGIEDDALSTPQGIARIRRFADQLKTNPIITDVTTLADLQRIDPSGASMEVRPFFPEGELDQTQVDAALKALNEDALFVPTFLSRDGKATALLAEMAGDLKATQDPEIRAEMERFAQQEPGGLRQLSSDEGLLSVLELARMKTALQVYAIAEAAGYTPDQIHPTGMPVAGGFLIDETVRHMGPFFGVTLLVVCILLGLLLRSPRSIFYCLVVALQAVLWAVGFGGTFNGRISIVAAMAPMIVLVLSVANVVHLVGQCRFERTRKDQDEAIIATFGEVGMACFLTSVTTLIGFSSLSFIPLVTAQELGVVCSVGVFASFILTFTIVPIFLSFFDLPAQTPQDSKMLFATMDWCQRMARQHPLRVLAASGVLTAVAIAGLNVLVIDTNLDAKFYDDHPIARSARFFSTRLSGGISAEVIIDTGRAGGALERDLFVTPAPRNAPMADKTNGTLGANETAPDQEIRPQDDEEDSEEFGIEEDGASPLEAKRGPAEVVDPIQGSKPNTYLVRLAEATAELKAYRSPNILDGQPIVLGAFSLLDVAQRTHRAMGGEGPLPNRAQLAAQIALFEGEGGEGLDGFMDRASLFTYAVALTESGITKLSSINEGA
jgi:hypothetical protein